MIPKNMRKKKLMKMKTTKKSAMKRIFPIPSPFTTKIKSNFYPWTLPPPLAGSKEPIVI